MEKTHVVVTLTGHLVADGYSCVVTEDMSSDGSRATPCDESWRLRPVQLPVVCPRTQSGDLVSVTGGSVQLTTVLIPL